MRKVWWLAIGGGVVLAGLLVVLGFALVRDDDNGGTDVTSEACKPAEATPSAGNANVEGRALGKGYARRIVIRVTDKQSGMPVQGAKVSEELPAAEKAIRTLNGAAAVVHPARLAGAEHHVIVEIGKVGRSDPKYPRSAAQVKAKPLG